MINHLNQLVLIELIFFNIKTMYKQSLQNFKLNYKSVKLLESKFFYTQ